MPLGELKGTFLSDERPCFVYCALVRLTVGSKLANRLSAAPWVESVGMLARTGPAPLPHCQVAYAFRGIRSAEIDWKCIEPVSTSHSTDYGVVWLAVAAFPREHRLRSVHFAVTRTSIRRRHGKIGFYASAYAHFPDNPTSASLNGVHDRDDRRRRVAT